MGPASSMQTSFPSQLSDRKLSHLKLFCPDDMDPGNLINAQDLAQTLPEISSEEIPNMAILTRALGEL